jgi:ABC-type phosphate transport system auxiliary subunit
LAAIITALSDFAFMRFMSNNMLTTEESQHKDEIIEVTEQVLDAKGLECDERISKLSEEKLREILEEVRKLRSSKKRKRIDQDLSDDDDDRSKKEVLYVNR